MKKILVAGLFALGLVLSCSKTAKYDPADGAEKAKEPESINAQEEGGAEDNDKYNE